MPYSGDEKTEAQRCGGAETRPPAPPPVLPEERTELHADTARAAPAAEPASLPAEDRTVLQPPAARGPPPEQAAPAADRTEWVPPPAPPLSRASELAAQQRTETLPPAAKPTGAAAPAPQHVAGYVLRHPLGAGTYGEVWLAEEERTGIRVAIKFLTHGTGVEWQLVQAEVKQLALLHADPGIVQLLDVELDAVPPYYVMAYAEQGSLAGRLDKGPLAPAEAVEIFRQLAEALAYVHAKGVRHCDLKPGNVLLNARGRALIADFGQAHLSDETAPALGTFFYMAPEQADLTNQIPDTRWDVYALGAILHAMLTGRPPREDAQARADLAATQDIAERLRRYRDWVRRAPRPDGYRRLRGVDRRLVEILDRCLEVDPARRLHDAGAVLAALARRERQHRQRPLLAFAFTAQVLLFLGMAAVAVWGAGSGVARSQAALTEQVLESDRVTASVAANGLQRELRTRKRLLERFAAEPDLVAAIKAGDKRELTRLMKRFNAVREPVVLSWVVTDAKGILLAVDMNIKLPAGKALPRSVAWRDWFNGRGDRFDRKDGEFAPISETYVSQPFVLSNSRELAIGISTPVFDTVAPKKVVGVLCTPVLLRDVHSWLDRVKIQDGMAVLVDRKGHCLRHRDEKRIVPTVIENPPTWSAPAFAKALRGEGGDAEHVDPIDGRTYLVGYAPLPEVGWGALVQHERSAAMKPIDDLKTQLIYLGVILLLAVPLLVSALWGWLIWTLRRKERVAQG